MKNEIYFADQLQNFLISAVLSGVMISVGTLTRKDVVEVDLRRVGPSRALFLRPL